MSEIGTCSECRKSPRHIHHRHPETKQPICSTCYLKFRIKKELEPEMFRKWFLNLTDDEAARWITDSAFRGNGDFVSSLTILLNSEAKSKLEWVLKLISRTVIAKKIIMDSLEIMETEEGEKIKSLIY